MLDWIDVRSQAMVVVVMLEHIGMSDKNRKDRKMVQTHWPRFYFSNKELTRIISIQNVETFLYVYTSTQ